METTGKGFPPSLSREHHSPASPSGEGFPLLLGDSQMHVICILAHEDLVDEMNTAAYYTKEMNWIPNTSHQEHTSQ